MLNAVVGGAARTVNLAEAMLAQAVLASWDATVVDEQARGMSTVQGGRAERAYATHLAGLLHVSRDQAVRQLHTAISLRGLPTSYESFLTGAFCWRSATSVVQNVGGLTGDARERFDAQAAVLAADTVPQLLDDALTRLHDSLDHDEATDRAATVFRNRNVRARRGAAGEASLVLTGPETDIAAMYETARRMAVAAHGAEGEDRPIGTLMFDGLTDVILHGLATAPVRPVTPAEPFERLGDLRVPQRRAISAEILVTVPAETVAGASNAPGRLSGWGSIAAAEVRRIVASARFWTRVEIDPVDDAILAFDSKERAIPAALRRLIQLRSETCDEPGCPTGAHLCDLDHVIRVEHGGRTVEINLSALCRPGHQTKDDGYIDVERIDGELVWHTRWGGRFVKKPAMRIHCRTPAAPAPEGWDPAPWDTAA